MKKVRKKENNLLAIKLQKNNANNGHICINKIEIIEINCKTNEYKNN